MRKPSKTSTEALAALLLLAAPCALPASLSTMAGSSARTLQPGPTRAYQLSLHASTVPAAARFFYPALLVVAEDPCSASNSKWKLLDWWRQTRASGWMQRYGRSYDPERPVVPFYLRSPLLSGFYSRAANPLCPGNGREADWEEPCAEVTFKAGLVQELRVEAALPQLESKNSRRLREAINARLLRNETVVLLTRQGEEYEIDPALTREVETENCLLKK